MQIELTSPSTVYIRFTGQQSPRYFCIHNSEGDLYHFRFTDGDMFLMKFNVPDPDTYTTNIEDLEVLGVKPIEIPVFYPPLPPAQRDRFKDLTVVYNPNLKDSPAVIYSQTGVVEVNDTFASLPPVMQEFILLHEQGHLLYVNEEFCDLWALINYTRKGYNRSVAYYTMFFILNQTQANINRLETLFNNIQTMQENEL